MSDLCIPFLHNFHLKNPFVVYKRVYVKDPKFLEVLWKKTETESQGCRTQLPRVPSCISSCVVSWVVGT